ncbi:MAG: AgmX/PglI C-terminal domain-containing protein [Thermodesulfobacteriota bacterium]
MNSDILTGELQVINGQIREVEKSISTLEGQLREVEDRLALFATDRKRYDALRTVSTALETLVKLEGADLFWGEGAGDTAGRTTEHVAGLQSRIGEFEKKVSVEDAEQARIKGEIDSCLDEIYDFNEEIRAAHARDVRRMEELLVVREVSAIPARKFIMPWEGNPQSARDFRRSMLIALLLCLFFGWIIPMIHVPVPERVVVEIPKRLAKLVKAKIPRAKPKPKPKKVKEEKKEEPKEKPKEAKPKKKSDKKVAKADKARKVKRKSARQKAEATGVLAFKSSFADLMEETPVARLGSAAQISKGSSRAPGGRTASRSLVAMQAQGGSGGIGTGSVSRNVGRGGSGGRMGGGVGFARVESSMADMVEQEGMPVSDGVGPARTDEEIQIVFDRYKALLYRIYNRELRKDPTLKGKILLKLTIQPDGSVSKCTVESTDLGSPALVKKVVERVKKFNFGAKEGVPPTTILYPIHFLPAG